MYASSHDVARYFGKEHKVVLVAIREILDSLTAQNCALLFRPTSYKQKAGFGERTYPAFDMTRDGFMLLVMGFTGTKALKIKVAYIEAFNPCANAPGFPGKAGSSGERLVAPIDRPSAPAHLLLAEQSLPHP